MGLDDGLPMKNSVRIVPHATCRINLKTILCRYDRGTDRSMVEFWIYLNSNIDILAYTSLKPLLGLVVLRDHFWDLWPGALASRATVRFESHQGIVW